MWKNVRALGFLIVLIAYIIFEGYQTFVTGKMPLDFKDLVMLVASFYYVTRAVEGRSQDKSNTASDKNGETEPISTITPEIVVPVPAAPVGETVSPTGPPIEG